MEKRVQQMQAEYQQAMSNLPEPEAAPSPQEGRYEDRKNVDLVGGLPSWMTGIDPVSEAQKQQAILAAQEKRNQQIAQINTMAGKPFEELTAGDKMGIALNLMGQNIFSSLTNIQWPDPKQLLLGLIDPRTSLTGVLGGLSQILSGGANLFSAEQWAKDPLGNFLKSAADIATGLTVVLGSITALAGLMTGILTAITIVSLGTAAPITGPMIAFCATVTATVGGWTLITGLVAAGLHSLALIKNLVDAATAPTAEDLQNQSEQMTQDFTNAGSAALQAVMAKLDKSGGRKLQNNIVQSGGGVRFAANMGAQGGVAGLKSGVQQAGGVKAYTRGIANNVKRNISGTIKEQGLGGFTRQTASKAWNGVKSTVRENWEDLTSNEKSLVPGSKGFSRDYLVGDDIPQGGSKAAANETRSAAGNTMIEETPTTIDKGVRSGEAIEGSTPTTKGDIQKPGLEGETPAPKAADGRVDIGDTPSEPVSARETSINESGRNESDQISSRQIKNNVPEHEPQASSNTELLENTANKTGKELSPRELEGELDIVNSSKRKPISEGDYVEEVELGNSHEWKRKENGTWCRFSPGQGDPCVPSGADGKPVLSTDESKAINTHDKSSTSKHNQTQIGAQEVPVQTGKQHLTYLPDTPESKEAAQTIVKAIADNFSEGKPMKGVALGVFTHEDGTVTYTVSGAQGKVEPIINALEGKLPPKYTPASSAEPQFKDLQPGIRDDGSLMPPRRTCAEPRLSQTTSESPVTGMSVVWVDGRKGPNRPMHYIVDDQGTMIPCESCQANRGKYLEDVNLSEGLQEWLKNNPSPKKTDIDQ